MEVNILGVGIATLQVVLLSADVSYFFPLSVPFTEEGSMSGIWLVIR